MSGPHAVLRFDGGPQIGGGHVVRGLALAAGLRRGGWRVTVACRASSVRAMPALARADVELLALDCGDADDGAAVGRAAGAAELAVVDHYGLDMAFESACRGWARRILVMDDLTHRRHDADLLVNPVPGIARADYGDRLSGVGRLALGPLHAPLREAFLSRRAASLARPAGPVRRLLVAFGATDPVDGTGLALEALRASAFDGPVDVVLGAVAPHLEAVRTRVAAFGGRARLHVEPADMAELLAGCDLVIGAAGSSAWERCCLGLPSLLVELVDNQAGIVAALAAAGAAQIAGRVGEVDAIRLAAMIDALVADEAGRAAMGRAAAHLCDGRGVDRIRCLLAGTEGRVALRPAVAGDAALLLDWQRHPQTRRFARTPEVPDAAGHQAWLGRVLGDPGRLLCIVEEDGAPAGSLRLDETGDGLEVSIYTAPERYRRGIGRAALALARRLAPGRVLQARVLEANQASHALFRGAGYRSTGEGHYVALAS